MSEPIWLDVDEVIDMHAEQLAIFGGPEGIRDRGLLESAVLRPVNQWNYGTTDMAALAAAYAFGLAPTLPELVGPVASPTRAQTARQPKPAARIYFDQAHVKQVNA